MGFKLFYQSTLSILIGLLGMLFSNSIIVESLSNPKIKRLPYIFQSSCILGMKNNIELAYAMKISTIEPTRNNYNLLILQNSIYLLIQTIAIGVLVGFMGGLNQICKGNFDATILVTVAYVSIGVCILSTIAFLTSFIISNIIFKKFNINSENFAIPILNALNDIFVVKMLRDLSLSSFDYSVETLIFLIFTIFCIFLSCLIFCLKTEGFAENLQLDKIWGISVVINLLTGFMVDDAAQDYPIINQTYLLYSNMCAALAYVYTHKMYSAIKNRRSLPESIKYTLVLIAFICSCIYVLISFFSSMNFKFLFFMGFILSITTQSFLMIEMISTIGKLPVFIKLVSSSKFSFLVAAFSDFVSVIFLILISNLS